MNKLIGKLLDLFFKIFKIKNKKTQEFITQFVKFGIVGFSNVFISYIINIGALFLLRNYKLSYDYIIANMIAFILSVLWSFYWNNKFVFEEDKNKKRNVLQALLKTYIAYSFSCIILNNILSWVWIDILGISKYIAPMINLIITIPINFVLNKLWAFKK